ncbi:peptidase inhibitor family I36 protein [Lentzea sp. NPDC055074]
MSVPRSRKYKIFAASIGLLLPLAVVPAAQAAGNCWPGDVCLFDGRDYTNQFWKASGCGDWDLGTMTPPLKNRASSVIIQTRSTVQIMHHYNGRWENQLKTSGSSLVQAPLNPDNATDRVKIC